MAQPIQINGTIDVESEDAGPDGTGTRVEFSLFDGHGRKHDLIIDLPSDKADPEDNNIDVWLVGSTVSVGDGPNDGFATYSF